MYQSATKSTLSQAKYREQEIAPSKAVLLFFDVRKSSNRIQEKLKRLLTEWRNATLFSSSVTDITSDPSYCKIIRMGKPIVPHLLKELDKSPEFLFAALRAITGDDPVYDAIRGDTRKMAEAWGEWGKQEGYIE